MEGRIKEQIEAKANYFAGLAKEALSLNSLFLMAVLLTERGSLKGEKNELERFIEDIEKGMRHAAGRDY